MGLGVESGLCTCGLGEQGSQHFQCICVTQRKLWIILLNSSLSIMQFDKLWIILLNSSLLIMQYDNVHIIKLLICAIEACSVFDLFFPECLIFFS